MTTVGLIGLGIMGMAYARNLRRAGVAVHGHDPAPAALASLADIGGVPCPSAADVAKAADVLLVALPSAAALAETVATVVPVLRPGQVLAEMGTLPIAAKQAARDSIAPTGATLLDCPVSGTGAQAEKADLVIYMSGPVEAAEQIRPVLAMIGKDVRHVGAFGDGMKLKLVANLLVTIHNLATAEALLLAQRSGLDLSMVYDAIAGGGAATSRMFEVRAPMMIAGIYEPATMKMDVYGKDLQLIMDQAREMDCPVPLMSASLPYYFAALAQGRAKQDTAALFAVLQQMAGAQVGGETT
jgi:L-threonate 2-dehydrogenase